MTWLIWRQYRAQFAVGSRATGRARLLLLLTGLQLARSTTPSYAMRGEHP